MLDVMRRQEITRGEPFHHYSRRKFCRLKNKLLQRGLQLFFFFFKLYSKLSPIYGIVGVILIKIMLKDNIKRLKYLEVFVFQFFCFVFFAFIARDDCPALPSRNGHSMLFHPVSVPCTTCSRTLGPWSLVSKLLTKP